MTGRTDDQRDPGLYARLMAEAERAGVAGHFRHLGMVPYEDVFGLNAAAEALINPSLFEGWSTTVEEAKALGTRMLLSDVTLHREQAPRRDVLRAAPARRTCRLAARRRSGPGWERAPAQRCVQRTQIAGAPMPTRSKAFFARPPQDRLAASTIFALSAVMDFYLKTARQLGFGGDKSVLVVCGGSYDQRTLGSNWRQECSHLERQPSPGREDLRRVCMGVPGRREYHAAGSVLRLGDRPCRLAPLRLAAPGLLRNAAGCTQGHPRHRSRATALCSASPSVSAWCRISNLSRPSFRGARAAAIAILPFQITFTAGRSGRSKRPSLPLIRPIAT